MNSGDTDDAPKWVQDTGCVSSNPSDDYNATFTPGCERHTMRLPDEFYLEVIVNTQNYLLHKHTFKVQWHINDLRPGHLPYGPVAEGYAWTVEKAKAMSLAMIDALRRLPTPQEDLDALDAQQPRPPLPPREQ